MLYVFGASEQTLSTQPIYDPLSTHLQVFAPDVAKLSLKKYVKLIPRHKEDVLYN